MMQNMRNTTQDAYGTMSEHNAKVFRQVYYPLNESCEKSRLLSLNATASDAGAKTMLCPYSRYNSENGVSNELADSTSSGIHFLRYRRSKTLQADTCFEKEHSHDRNMFLVMNRLKRVPHSLIALPGSLLPGGK